MRLHPRLRLCTTEGWRRGRHGTRCREERHQLQRLVTSISGLDGRLSDATTLTDTKFTQLNEQMNVISEFIDEDREFRDQLRRVRREEIKQLEEVVNTRFDKEAQVSPSPSSLPRPPVNV